MHLYKREGSWQPATIIDRIFVSVEDRSKSIPEKQIIGDTPTTIVPMESVDCPSLVIAYLPDEGTENYSSVKMACQFFNGCQSQCVSANKYGSQKRKEQ